MVKDASSRTYIVYKHTSPSGKVYVGITSRSPEARWGKDGVEYKANKHFWNAIQKYGWDSFDHEIVCTDLNYVDACEKEKELIAKYNCMNPAFGYNQTSGGDGGRILSPEVKLKIVSAVKERWKNPAYKQHFHDIMVGRYISPETICKISESNKRTKALHPRTPEQTAKWRISVKGKMHPKNKGVYGVFHHTDETKAKIGAASKGHVTSEEQKRKLSEARKGKFHHTDEIKEKLRKIALDMSQEQRDKISESVKLRWAEGCYANRPKPEITDEYRNHMREIGRKNVRVKGTFHHTQEAKDKMSASHKGKPAYNRKSVQCVETGVIYESIAQAENSLNVGNISSIVDKPNRTAGKLHFITYHNDKESDI